MEISKKKNQRYQEFVLLGCIYLFVFQDVLEWYFRIFKLWDEVFAIISIVLIIKRQPKFGKRFRWSKSTLELIILLFVFAAAGFAGNFLYKYQETKYAVFDLFLNLKFFLAVVTGYYLFRNPINRQLMKKVAWHCKLLCAVFVLLYLADSCFHIFSVSSSRYGIHVAQLFYQHSTYLASTCTFLIMLLLMYDVKKTKGYVIALAILMALTMRSKAIAAAFLILLLIWYVIYKGQKISIKNLVFMGGIIALIAFPQINFYYMKLAGKSARSVLTQTSIRIANDYFPIGTGFGTYASHYSGVNYSQVYFKYGQDTHGEIGITTRKFISDTFWPMIVAQNGVIGLTAYAGILLIFIYKIGFTYKRGARKNYCCCMIGFVYLLISSAAESAFVNPLSMPIAFCLGINFYSGSRYPERRHIGGQSIIY